MRVHPLFACVALLAAAEARTSQVHYEDISLETLVEGTALVVVASPADPPQRVEKIDITPNGHKKNQDKWPPYHRVIRRFVVHEVVRMRDPSSYSVGLLRAPPAGTVIEVMGAHARSEESLHVRYYVDGESKSPIYSRYAGTAREDEPLTVADKRMLFLQPVDGEKKRYAFVADNAVERVEQRAAVEALWPPVPQPTGSGSAVPSPPPPTRPP